MAVVVAGPGSPCTFDFMSPVRTIDRLNEALAGPRGRVMQWRKDRTHAAHIEAQRSTQELRREHACVEDLRADLFRTNQLKEAAANMRVEGTQLQETIRQTIDVTAKRTESVRFVKEQLCKAHESCLQQIGHEAEAFEKQRSKSDARNAEIEHFIELYKERLGLKITRVAPQTMRYVFTMIDECDLIREFSFNLGLVDSQAYCICDCDPLVPQLGLLLDCLNTDRGSSSALPTFVCGMRQAFQEVSKKMLRP